VLAILFLVSGFSALVYQVLWTRMLGLVFGVTIHAASALLATYMAGLAVGSVAAGRIADRLRHPLRAFGLVEIGIAAAALASPHVLRLVEDAYQAVYPALGNQTALVAGSRVLLAAALLLVPTALMGATLPLVLKSSLTGGERLATRTSLLYGTNTTGAIAGTIAAGFALLPLLGMRSSFLVAAAGNLTVGGGALALAAWRPTGGAHGPADADDHATAPPPGGSRASGLPRASRVALGIAGISGFVGLALEIVWFRVLVLFLGPTTYAFTSMLGAVLFGIALGSFVIAPWLRRRADLAGLLAALQIGFSVAVLLSLSLLAHGHAIGRALGQLTTRPFGDYLTVLAVVSLVSMVPASALSGASFPVALTLWSRGRGDRDIGRRMGVFYAVNVTGAIVGALAGGYVLLPVLGARWSLILLALLPLPLAGVLLATIANRARMIATTAAGSAAVIAALLLAPDPFDVLLDRFHHGEEVLFRAEGVQTTVSVHQRRRERIMYLDGRHQANDTPDTLYQHRRIGLLPVVLHDDPGRALVIGLGGGATAGAMARYPNLHLTVVELSKSVIEGAEWFAHANFDVLRRPSVDLRVGDGRNHLMLTSDRYDIVAADIILPVHAGATNLYSAEYFRLVRNALSPRGLFVQWIGSEAEAEYKLIARTFLSVFRNATLWGGGSLLIGGRWPLSIDVEAIERRLADPAVRTALEPVGIRTVHDVLGLFDAGPDTLRAFVGEGPILTDDRPMVEYFLTLPRYPEVDLSGLRSNVEAHLRRR